MVSLEHSILACSVSQYFDSEAEVWHICSKHLWCLESLIMLSESKWPLFSQPFFLSPNVTVSLDAFRHTTPTLPLSTANIFWSCADPLTHIWQSYWNGVLTKPVKFSISPFIFSSHYSLLSIQKLRAVSKPWPPFLLLWRHPREIQAIPSVALCLPQVTGTNTNLCAAQHLPVTQVCSSPSGSLSLLFLLFL